MGDLLTGGLTATEEDRISEAEALVRAYCGWHIAPSRTDTVTVRPTGGRVAMLPSLHVTDVANLAVDGDAPLALSTDYIWSAAGVVTRDGHWGCEVAIEVEFTHGYDECPAEIRSVIRAVAQRSVSNPGSTIRSQAGPFSESYSQTGPNQSIPMALLEAEKDILRRYRIPTVA